MRPIDADEVERKLVKKYVHLKDCSDAIDVIREMIQAMPTIDPSNWILCAERLPKKSVHCYTTVVDTRCGARYVGEMHFVFPTKKWERVDKDLLAPCYEVVAWQEPPMPWREPNKCAIS